MSSLLRNEAGPMPASYCDDERRVLPIDNQFGYRPTPLLRRRVLDEQMAWLRAHDPQPWGVWPWLGPLAALFAVIGAAAAVRPLVPAAGTARFVAAVVITAVGELLIVLAVWAFGRRVVRVPGGWRVTLGLGWITGRDWAVWGVGLGATFAGRIVLNVVANTLTHGRAGAEASNLRVGQTSVVALIVLGVFVLAVAPLVEETLFRGVMLRTFLRRLSFWPAAVLSSAIFGGLHVYEVDTAVGMVTLALNVGLLGLVNCYLVRISGRLTPAVMLHFTYNLFGYLYLVFSST